MMSTEKPRTYKAAVYWRDDDGVWHHHGTWEGEAGNPADAKTQAVEALADDRIEGWKAEILDSKPAPKPKPRGRHAREETD
jgi:hypothetical protein